jgi:hypothetical protein
VLARPIPLTRFHRQLDRDFDIVHSGSDKAPIGLIALADISLKAKNMKSISLFLLTVAGFCPVLFSSCATNGTTSDITTPSARGKSLASTAYYNPAEGEFNPKWPYGPNTYR